jgi:hypothetical protein
MIGLISRNIFKKQNNVFNENNLFKFTYNSWSFSVNVSAVFKACPSVSNCTEYTTKQKPWNKTKER